MAEEDWDGTLTIEQGTRWVQPFQLLDPVLPETDPPTYVPRSLAGRQVRMQCRRTTRSSEVLFALSSEGADPGIEIEPDPADWPESEGDTTGWFVCRMGATKTAAIPRGGMADIETYDPLDPDDVDRPISDIKVVLSREVTR